MISISQVAGYKAGLPVKPQISRDNAVVKAVMKSGASQSMAHAGTATVSAKARGTRKMFHL